MAISNNRRAKKKAGIEVDPEKTILILRRTITPPPGIAVIDEKTQRQFPSLLVSSTLTVQKDQLGLFRDSEPKMQHDK